MASRRAAAVCAVLLSLCACAAAGGMDAIEANRLLGEMNKKLNRTLYLPFLNAYFDSSAPLALFEQLTAGHKVTLFVPVRGAFERLDAAVTGKEAFGDLVLHNGIRGDFVSWSAFQKAAVGSYWTSTFKNRKVYKRAADAISVSASAAPANQTATVKHWKVFRKQGTLVVHGVDYYFVPK